MDWNKEHAVESKEVLKDLHLILSHIDKNDGKFLLLLKAKKKVNENVNMQYINSHNLNYAELLETYISFIKLIQNELNNKPVCNCNKCMKAEKILNGIMENYEFLNM